MAGSGNWKSQTPELSFQLHHSDLQFNLFANPAGLSFLIWEMGLMVTSKSKTWSEVRIKCKSEDRKRSAPWLTYKPVGHGFYAQVVLLKMGRTSKGAEFSCKSRREGFLFFIYFFLKDFIYLFDRDSQ